MVYINDLFLMLKTIENAFETSYDELNLLSIRI